MRTRILKTVNGKVYLCAASAKSKKLWLNPQKTEVRRKTLKELWS